MPLNNDKKTDSAEDIPSGVIQISPAGHRVIHVAPINKESDESGDETSEPISYNDFAEVVPVGSNANEGETQDKEIANGSRTCVEAASKEIDQPEDGDKTTDRNQRRVHGDNDNLNVSESGESLKNLPEGVRRRIIAKRMKKAKKLEKKKEKEERKKERKMEKLKNKTKATEKKAEKKKTKREEKQRKKEIKKAAKNEALDTDRCTSSSSDYFDSTEDDSHTREVKAKNRQRRQLKKKRKELDNLKKLCETQKNEIKKKINFQRKGLPQEILGPDFDNGDVNVHSHLIAAKMELEDLKSQKKTMEKEVKTLEKEQEKTIKEKFKVLKAATKASVKKTKDTLKHEKEKLQVKINNQLEKKILQKENLEAQNKKQEEPVIKEKTEEEVRREQQMLACTRALLQDKDIDREIEQKRRRAEMLAIAEREKKEEQRKRDEAREIEQRRRRKEMMAIAERERAKERETVKQKEREHQTLDRASEGVKNGSKDSLDPADHGKMMGFMKDFGKMKEDEHKQRMSAMRKSIDEQHKAALKQQEMAKRQEKEHAAKLAQEKKEKEKQETKDKKERLKELKEIQRQEAKETKEKKKQLAELEKQRKKIADMLQKQEDDEAKMMAKLDQEALKKSIKKLESERRAQSHETWQIECKINTCIGDQIRKAENAIRKLKTQGDIEGDVFENAGEKELQQARQNAEKLQREFESARREVRDMEGFEKRAELDEIEHLKQNGTIDAFTLERKNEAEIEKLTKLKMKETEVVMKYEDELQKLIAQDEKIKREVEDILDETELERLKEDKNMMKQKIAEIKKKQNEKKKEVENRKKEIAQKQAERGKQAKIEFDRLKKLGKIKEKQLNKQMKEKAEALKHKRDQLEKDAKVQKELAKKLEKNLKLGKLEVVEKLRKEGKLKEDDEDRKKKERMKELEKLLEKQAEKESSIEKKIQNMCAEEKQLEQRHTEQNAQKETLLKQMKEIENEKRSHEEKVFNFEKRAREINELEIEEADDIDDLEELFVKATQELEKSTEESNSFDADSFNENKPKPDCKNLKIDLNDDIKTEEKDFKEKEIPKEKRTSNKAKNSERLKGIEKINKIINDDFESDSGTESESEADVSEKGSDNQSHFSLPTLSSDTSLYTEKIEKMLKERDAKESTDIETDHEMSDKKIMSPEEMRIRNKEALKLRKKAKKIKEKHMKKLRKERKKKLKEQEKRKKKAKKAQEKAMKDFLKKQKKDLEKEVDSVNKEAKSKAKLDKKNEKEKKKNEKIKSAFANLSQSESDYDSDDEMEVPKSDGIKSGKKLEKKFKQEIKKNEKLKEKLNKKQADLLAENGGERSVKSNSALMKKRADKRASLKLRENEFEDLEISDCESLFEIDYNDFDITTDNNSFLNAEFKDQIKKNDKLKSKLKEKQTLLEELGDSDNESESDDDDLIDKKSAKYAAKLKKKEEKLKMKAKKEKLKQEKKELEKEIKAQEKAMKEQLKQEKKDLEKEVKDVKKEAKSKAKIEKKKKKEMNKKPSSKNGPSDSESDSEFEDEIRDAEISEKSPGKNSNDDEFTGNFAIKEDLLQNSTNSDLNAKFKDQIKKNDKLKSKLKEKQNLLEELGDSDDESESDDDDVIDKKSAKYAAKLKKKEEKLKKKAKKEKLKKEKKELEKEIKAQEKAMKEQLKQEKKDLEKEVKYVKKEAKSKAKIEKKKNTKQKGKDTKRSSDCQYDSDSDEEIQNLESGRVNSGKISTTELRKDNSPKLDLQEKYSKTDNNESTSKEMTPGYDEKIVESFAEMVNRISKSPKIQNKMKARLKDHIKKNDKLKSKLKEKQTLLEELGDSDNESDSDNDDVMDKKSAKYTQKWKKKKEKLKKKAMKERLKKEKKELEKEIKAQEKAMKEQLKQEKKNLEKEVKDVKKEAKSKAKIEKKKKKDEKKKNKKEKGHEEGFSDSEYESESEEVAESSKATSENDERSGKVAKKNENSKRKKKKSKKKKKLSFFERRKKKKNRTAYNGDKSCSSTNDEVESESDDVSSDSEDEYESRKQALSVIDDKLIEKLAGLRTENGMNTAMSFKDSFESKHLKALEKNKLKLEQSMRKKSKKDEQKILKKISKDIKSDQKKKLAKERKEQKQEQADMATFMKMLFRINNKSPDNSANNFMTQDVSSLFQRTKQKEDPQVESRDCVEKRQTTSKKVKRELPTIATYNGGKSKNIFRKDCKKELENLRANLDLSAEQIEELKRYIRELKPLKSENIDLIQQIYKLQEQVRLKENFSFQTFDSQTRRIKRLCKKIYSLQSETVMLTKDKHSLEDSVKTLKAEKQDVKAERNSERLKNKNLAARLEKYRTEYKTLQETIEAKDANHRNEVTRVLTECRNLVAKNENNSRFVERLKTRIIDLETSVAAYKRNIEQHVSLDRREKQVEFLTHELQMKAKNMIEECQVECDQQKQLMKDVQLKCMKMQANRHQDDVMEKDLRSSEVTLLKDKVLELKEKLKDTHLKMNQKDSLIKELKNSLVEKSSCNFCMRSNEKRPVNLPSGRVNEKRPNRAMNFFKKQESGLKDFQIRELEKQVDVMQSHTKSLEELKEKTEQEKVSLMESNRELKEENERLKEKSKKTIQKLTLKFQAMKRTVNAALFNQFDMNTCDEDDELAAHLHGLMNDFISSFQRSNNVNSMKPFQPTPTSAIMQTQQNIPVKPSACKCEVLKHEASTQTVKTSAIESNPVKETQQKLTYAAATQTDKQPTKECQTDPIEEIDIQCNSESNSKNVNDPFDSFGKEVYDAYSQTDFDIQETECEICARDKVTSEVQTELGGLRTNIGVLSDVAPQIKYIKSCIKRPDSPTSVAFKEQHLQTSAVSEMEYTDSGMNTMNTTRMDVSDSELSDNETIQSRWDETSKSHSPIGKTKKRDHMITEANNSTEKREETRKPKENFMSMIQESKAKKEKQQQTKKEETSVQENTADINETRSVPLKDIDDVPKKSIEKPTTTGKKSSNLLTSLFGDKASKKPSKIIDDDDVFSASSYTPSFSSSRRRTTTLTKETGDEVTEIPKKHDIDIEIGEEPSTPPRTPKSGRRSGHGMCDLDEINELKNYKEKSTKREYYPGIEYERELNEEEKKTVAKLLSEPLPDPFAELDYFKKKK